MYKSYEEWGLPPFDNECYICGHSTMSNGQKFIGFQEIEPDPDDKTIYARFHPICSICAQVQLVANKEYLHCEKDTPNCWKPIKRIFLCHFDRVHLSVYEVLDNEPWVKMVQSSKEGRQ
jgi:hypothetical protein